MYVSGAKFEEHCSNISGDILDWVFYYFSGTTYDVITFLICIIQKRKYKDIPKRKTLFFFTLKAFQISTRIYGPSYISRGLRNQRLIFLI